MVKQRESTMNRSARPLPAERIFSLVATLLGAGRPMTRDEILERMAELYVPHGTEEPDPETLRKMFERDKHLIKEMGIPLQKVMPELGDPDDLGEGQVGYRIVEQDLSVPEIQLDETQRMLVATVVQTLLSSPDFPLREDLAMAAHKLLLADSGGLLAGEGSSHLVIDSEGWSVTARVRSLVETALTCVHERRSLRIHYRAAGRDETTQRTVDPYGLTLMQGSWLLTGFCHLRRGNRTFAVHRIVKMQPVDPQGPGGQFEVPEDFRAHQVGRIYPWRYSVHPPVDVVVEADRDFAWHARTILGDPDGDGAPARWSLRASNVDALVELALIHGPRIRVVSPASVAGRIVDEIRRMGSPRGGPARNGQAGGPVDPEGQGRSGRDDALTRLRRYTFLVSYLSRVQDASLERLCDLLGVGRSVLVADLQRLSLCGVYPSTEFRLFDISVDQTSGRVRFRKNPVPSLARPVKLTRREIVALLLGLKTLADTIAPPFDWAADNVIRQVIQAAGEEARSVVQELQQRVSMGTTHELGWDTFYALSRAVTGRRRVRITYYTHGRDSVGQRVVHPYVLVCSVGRWYLLAHCEWRDDVRTFRLDRIRSAEMLPDGFTPPARFDPRNHLDQHIYPPAPEDDEVHRVVVAFEPAAVSRSRPLASRAEAGPDGWMHVPFCVPPERYQGFLSWLVSFTTRFRIVSPEALQEALEQRRQRLLAPYH